MSGYDLLSSDHFHVILHPDKKHGLIINRLDETISCINYDDAKELSNLSKGGTFYGIVGKYLSNQLVLIKDRTYIGTLYEPSTKSDHDIYSIKEVQVIEIALDHSINNLQNQRRASEASVCNTITPKYQETINQKTKPISQEVRDSNLDFDNSDDYDHFASLPISINTNNYNNSKNPPWNPFNKFSNPFKNRNINNYGNRDNSLLSNRNLNNNNKPMPSSSSSHPSGGSSQGPSLQDDSDRRLTEEMVKLFNGTQSFYFSPTLDLTNRFARKNRIVKKNPDDSIWKTADERFFWNKHMLKDFLGLSDKNNDANYFICVILQGFISIEQVEISQTCLLGDSSSSNSLSIEKGLLATTVNFTSVNNNSTDTITSCDQILLDEKITPYPYEDKVLQNANNKNRVHQLALISRRSVLQAGTRYRRRGCDSNGNCANFVETEQIFRSGQHFNSLILLRGSIPLFWYQTGLNYRPPPVLSRTDEENQEAFSKHFLNLMKLYETNQIIAIDCTEHNGREKPIHDAYKRHMDRFRETYSNVQLIEFDFHRHCRRRQCSDSQIERHLKLCGLTDQLTRDIKYYWNDGEVVWEQDGLFRVNCLDCTDRTNVVQRCVALSVLDFQLARLGIIAPDTSFEDNQYRRIMRDMWSANGNVLSTQYCGTKALFTGEKKLSGLIQDTYSSASRYYISKFRDSYRQAAIDAMLGIESDPNQSDQNNHQSYSKNNKQGNHNPSSSYFDKLDLMDPFFSSARRSSGSALLKDVGNRVSNRLARLRGKLQSNTDADWGTVNMSRLASVDDSNGTELMEARINDRLAKMSIDWPSSSESISEPTNLAENSNQEITKPNMCNRAVDDSDGDDYQDDDFSQLMLSMDLAEIHRLEKQAKELKSSNDSKYGNIDSFNRYFVGSNEDAEFNQKNQKQKPEKQEEEEEENIHEKIHLKESGYGLRKHTNNIIIGKKSASGTSSLQDKDDKINENCKTSTSST